MRWKKTDDETLRKVLNLFLDYAIFNWKAKLFSTKYNINFPLNDEDINALISGFIEEEYANIFDTK